MFQVSDSNKYLLVSPSEFHCFVGDTSILVMGSITVGVMGQITIMGFAHTMRPCVLEKKWHKNKICSILKISFEPKNKCLSFKLQISWTIFYKTGG
jgi:hypothetical protein